MTSEDIDKNSNFVDQPRDEVIIKVIGVGGGGNNAISHMYGQDIKRVSFVIINTDRQALNNSPVPNRVLIGRDGLGAGNDPEVARLAAEESAEEIAKLFDDETKMVFITAGMGGGTGTGAAPVVARIAQEKGMLTIGIVTIPFLFEGQKKILKALDGAEEMSKYVDAILVVNNEQLTEIYSDLNWMNAFGKADDTLANAARSISEIISETLYINVDFQDVKTTLKDSGTAIISTAYGEGEHRISDAIHNALHSPLLKAHDINTSKRLLLKFTCWRESPNPIRTEEITEITEFTAKLPSSIDVKWGIGDDPSMGDRVKITVLAAGFDVTINDGKENGKEDGTIIKFPSGNEDQASPQAHDESKKKIEEVYGADKLNQQRKMHAKMKYAVLKPSQFDDHDVIALIESTPTYNRAPRFNDELRKISEHRDNETRQDFDDGSTETITF